VTTRNPLHCGGCDMPCAATERCAGGMCRLRMVRDAGPPDAGPPDTGAAPPAP
jgi:hypothetical protein